MLLSNKRKVHSTRRKQTFPLNFKERTFIQLLQFQSVEGSKHYLKSRK